MTLSSCTLCPTSCLSALVLSYFFCIQQGNQTKLALQMLSPPLREENSLLIEVGKHALKLHCSAALANASASSSPSFSQRVTFAWEAEILCQLLIFTNVSPSLQIFQN